jgi:catalase
VSRRIAIIVADGVDVKSLQLLHEGLAEKGAMPRYVGAKLGSVHSSSGGSVEVEVTLETAPSVLWDACILPDGKDAIETLSGNGQVLEFIKDQYRHCKPVLALGQGGGLLEKAAIPATLVSGERDPGILLSPTVDVETALVSFSLALAQHRHFARETNPPRV